MGGYGFVWILDDSTASVTRIDAYPMPRIDELLDRIGKAQYIITLDLTRGY